jgi:Predicted membrane protein
MKNQKPGWSLTLEIIFYVEKVYSVVYFFLEMMLYIFRGYFLTYPTSALGIELASLFFFGVIQFLRVFIGNYYTGMIGNKTERSDILISSFILMIPSIFGGVFFIRLQVYV